MIWICAETRDGHVTVRVRDNGPGIPANMLTEIFEMFRQGDDSLERANGGLGIGLTLVKRLVEEHGGTIEARSEGPGRGSEFVVTLPTCEAESMVDPSRGRVTVSINSRGLPGIASWLSMMLPPRPIRWP